MRTENLQFLRKFDFAPIVSQLSYTEVDGEMVTPMTVTFDKATGKILNLDNGPYNHENATSALVEVKWSLEDPTQWKLELAESGGLEEPTDRARQTLLDSFQAYNES